MFLATTALPEFWDKKQEILFLGPWCLRADREAEWRGLKYQVMPNPWDDRERYAEAARYLDELGERWLACLAEYLNTMHRVSYRQRFWRILVGPWLMHYLHIMYDRYAHLSEAFRRYDHLDTFVLAPSAYRVPNTTIEFIEQALDDPFNQQLFSQLLCELGRTFPEKDFDALEAKPGDAKRERAALSVWRKAAMRGGEFVQARVRDVLNKGRVALCDTHLSRSARWSLAERSGFEVLPMKIFMPEEALKSVPLSFNNERRGLCAMPSVSEFERVCAQILSRNFPSLYLEGFDLLHQAAARSMSGVPSVVVSSFGWYFDERFKYQAAVASEQGARMVAVQYGGGYGLYRTLACEQHEARLADSYYTWGWGKGNGSGVQSLPDPTLSALLHRYANPSESSAPAEILFVSTALPRYLYRFSSWPVGSQVADYLEDAMKFLDVLPAHVLGVVRFRPYVHEYGHDIRRRVVVRFPTIKWDERAQAFPDALGQCRLVVVDHCGTSFLEALVANKPTITFWNPTQWETRTDAKESLDLLRMAGMLFDSPRQAAAKVCETYDEVSRWWGSAVVQDARRRFIDRYALAREDWLDRWTETLEEELATSKGLAPAG
ncbi:MAG: hypothetical protein FJ245_05175 [Nitrospira sp.]|nr:hypothetical protein [Nitrospira sp.]